MKKYLMVTLLILCSLLLFSCANIDMYNPNDIGFSLDDGKSWQKIGGELEEFDIWNVDSSGTDKSMIFFSATTYDELLNVINISKENNNTTNYNNLEQLKNTYNKEYFKNYILLYYFKYEANISQNYVYNVTIANNNLTLNINRFEGKSTAVSSWKQIVSIKKRDVGRVNHFNVSIRTISPLVDSITFSIADSYVRDIYMNGLTKSDFNGLDNLKDISLFRWSLNVDIKFNTTLTDERLKEIIGIFENSPNVSSIGYTSLTWIRIQANPKFLDSVLNNTLMITDLIPISILDSSTFSINCLSFEPFAIVTLYLTKPGKINADVMVNQLNQLNFPFINKDTLIY